MANLLKPVVITLLVGIVGTLMVSASQWYPASEVRADAAFHIRLPHLVEDELYSNKSSGKSSEYISQELSDFLELVNDVPLYNILLGISLVAVGLFLHHYVYKTLFHPLNLVRKFGEVGYITDGSTQEEVAEVIRKRKRIRAGNIPPVYPNGWFSLARSKQLKKGQVDFIHALGDDFIVYRGDDGEPHILNGICPHDGTNLGKGKVKGDCIQCPTGGCTFRGSDGKCVIKPNNQKVPEDGNIKAWQTFEINNEVYFWYHAEGIEPDWYPTEIEMLKNMNFHGYSEHWINSHIEEIPENGADFAHFEHLHGPYVPNGRDLRYRFQWLWDWVRFTWAGDWHREEGNKHVGVMELYTAHKFRGKMLKSTRVDVQARQVGPSIVQVHLKHGVLGSICLIQAVLPVEPLVQKVTHHVYTTWRIPRFLAKFFLWQENFQVERDMMVWNYKTFLNKPVLVKEEGVISRHRRWYSQFYSENSPRFESRKDGFEY